MKNLILSIFLLIGLNTFSQAYTEYIKPNTLNVKECTYGTDFENALTFLVNDNTGDVYMLWTKLSPDFNPPTQLPLNWTMKKVYYETAKSWTFHPVNGWLGLNDEHNNFWIKQH